MRWYQHLAYFLGGAFLMNMVPHLVSGAMGHPFQSPFATPPGEGLSSAMVNVVWGYANLVMAYLLIYRVAKFNVRDTKHILHVAAGSLAMSLLLAHHFATFYNGG